MLSLLLPGPLPRQHVHPHAQPFWSGRAAVRLTGAVQSSAAASGLDLACYTLIVDDIVLPSGETIMESLGGGGALTKALSARILCGMLVALVIPARPEWLSGSASSQLLFSEQCVPCCSSSTSPSRVQLPATVA